MRIKFKYSLTTAGDERCTANNGEGEFYLQKTPNYRGHTKKLFRALHDSKKPLNVHQISEKTGLRTRIISSLVASNMPVYIKKELISPPPKPEPTLNISTNRNLNSVL